MNKQITPTKSALNFESRIAGLLGDLIHMSQTQDLRIQAIEKQLLYLMGPRTDATTEKFIADLELHKARMEAHSAKASPPAVATTQPKTRIQ